MTKENDLPLFPKGAQLPGEWFTGAAYLHPLVAKDHNHEFSASSVSFEAGARTNWHTHPKGQILMVTEGSGFYQEKNKPAQRIQKGDVINIPENTEHWHGAAATTAMTHIAITNFKDNEQVTWLAPVTANEFNKANNKQ
ncbi:(R)-mandelonitrile lyase [Niabella sp. 22666]|uniref:(R)-mandelonitrile lyase n=1 Tax=Niabella sp. 22666 TaxID=3453954 RepID=UPI003F84F573